MKKRIISLVTSIMMAVGLVGYIPTESVSAENNSQSTPYISNEVNVEGTNSFGTMLADVLEGEQTEQEANNGHNVFSIEMNGKEADVEFQTLTDCTLVVAVYDETGETLVATGSTEVTTEMEETTVNIEVKEMPEYFYLRGFLIEENTFRPLCTAYESNIYTKEMQEFLAKTTDDFDKELVLNLDEDKTNNFAVFSEDTVIVNEGTTKLVSANDTTLTYVFENADAQMKALKKDDVFAFEKTDGEVLIVKVASVATNGTKLTITGQDTELEDVFDYVKIDTEAEDEDISIDTSAPLEEGITYLGEVDYNSYSPDEYGIQTMAWEGDESVETGFSFKIDLKKGTVNLNGSLALKMSVALKYYLSFSKQYVEFTFSTSAKATVTLSGKVSKEIVLLPIGISPAPGIYIDLSPKLAVEASVAVSVSGEIKTVNGFKLSDGKLSSISKQPTFSSQINISGKIYIGLKIDPKISIITDDILNGSMSIKAGVELTAVPHDSSKNPNEKHACDVCLDGTINSVFEISAQIKLFNWDRMTFSVNLLSSKSKLCDFYYSGTFDEVGKGKCPHISYKVTVTTRQVEKASKIVPLANSAVTFKQVSSCGGGIYEVTTDADGKYSIYLPTGKYSLTAQSGNLTCKKGLEIGNEAVMVDMILRKPIGIDKNVVQGIVDDLKNFDENRLALGYGTSAGSFAYIDDNGDLYMWGYNNEYGILGDGTTYPLGYPQDAIMNNVKSVTLCGGQVAAITKYGDLYMWGRNQYGQLGDGTTEDRYTPVKIMDNVKSVSLGEYHSAAITTDGSLYMWGWNNGGQLGIEGTEECNVPIKIMDNVKSIYLSDYSSAAITKDNTLYMWGAIPYNDKGENGSSVPMRIMDGVNSVVFGGWYSNAIIKEDGSLYTWGINTYGQLGDGTTEDRYTLVKIMDNVQMVYFEEANSAAITKDGGLYLWGANWGILGDGTTEDKLTPVKIMDNVKSVSLGGLSKAAITTDGSLYMWGENDYGQLGDGTTDDRYTPVKIMDNVQFVKLGGSSTAAISEDGSLYLWGSNITGDKNVPERITVPFETSEISLASTEIMPLALINEYPAFSDLLPNMVYNIYAVQSRNAEEPLCSANLLFISQAVSNENGEIYGNFRPFAETENMEWFCVPMAQTDISGAEVTLSEYEYTGEEQFVKPVVTLDDKVLTEGDDYYLEGDYSFTKPGEYEVTVRGTGLYTGTVSVQYTVGGLVGDINFDSTINMKDLAALQRYLNGWEVEINEAAADLDSDDKITMKDLVALQRITNGWEN